MIKKRIAAVLAVTAMLVSAIQEKMFLAPVSGLLQYGVPVLKTPRLGQTAQRIMQAPVQSVPLRT